MRRGSFAAANFDASQLDSFAFASRKRPGVHAPAPGRVPACDMLYASPAPAGGAVEARTTPPPSTRRRSRATPRATYGSFLPGIVERLPSRDGALDIGTGDGAFLRELIKAGFSGVTGVEPSAAPIAAAEPAVRGLIRHGPFRPEEFSAEQFRLVTCFQTMEHVFDPLQLCRDAYRITKPGGAFFIVCHNRRSVLARVLGRRSPIYDVEHLQLFSPRSVRVLLERAGFREVEVRPDHQPLPDRYWAKLLPARRRSRTRCWACSPRPGSAPLSLPAPVGNLAAIGWR